MAHVKDAGDIKPIRRLLVANRGEIARRIMATATRMGISTVAIYADGDTKAPYVLEADHAIRLVGRTSAETYLDMDKVINACIRSDADALHPGYGFLSENAEFARRVEDAGITWIGPSPAVIAAMGDKLSAKKLMQEAGVPTLPAIEITDETDIHKAANEIGFPVLVKASAGGGGRGMRIVETEADLEAGIASARREAISSFGDDTVFLEKWLSSSRHIEIQIIGDTHGNLVHCFERECSIQRRHQKIIEEAPSSAVTQEIRDAMGKAAITAAKKLGYSSAGTVEFLLSGNDFWFLEVNARLQVEHPVTEEIIGHDLVREQIRIAEGETLSFTQESLTITGHAIEARLCAEDPDNNFLPSPGTITHWIPATGPGTRFDSGVEAGSIISPDFDAMIAKVIVHAPTRREAAAQLARVLESSRIQGLTTNRDFLVATLRHPAFLAGDTTTDFIERVNPLRKRQITEYEVLNAAIAVVMESQALNRASARVLKSIPSGWRNSRMPFESLSFTTATGATDGISCEIAYQSVSDGTFRVRAGFAGEPILAESESIVRVYQCGAGEVDVEVDGLRLHYLVARETNNWMVHGPEGDLCLTQRPRYPLTDTANLSGGLAAPMPGSVLSRVVNAGDLVKKGDLLLILEAMKMEHRITAPADGVVAEVHVATGDQVVNGQLLVTITDQKDQG